MTRNGRTILVVGGAAILFFSLILLIYAFWPLPSVQDQSLLAPTLFVQPH
jgi:hypothetical protein